MAKDPAFLFYSSDFLVGTMRMSYEQKGKYIYLLCLQHQDGKIHESDMKDVLSNSDNKVLSKFKKDGEYYYNERLEEVVSKRKAYSESRRKNRMSKKDMSNTCKTYDKHMENENENETINEDIIVIENKIPYKEITNYWNDYSQLKPIVKLTDKRKSMINARFNEYDLDSIKNMIDNISNSPFLKGQNKRNWIADFEWCFKPNNFIKILEGNYSNNSNVNVQTETDLERRVRIAKERLGEI